MGFRQRRGAVSPSLARPHPPARVRAPPSPASGRGNSAGTYPVFRKAPAGRERRFCALGAADMNPRIPLLVARGLAAQLGGPGGFRLHVPDFMIMPGDRVAVVGPSGSGKSTFLALLALALRPAEAADFFLQDSDIAILWAKENDPALARLRARAIGFVPQTGLLLPFLTLRRNIALTQLIAGRDDPARVEALADRLGLSGLLDRMPDEVSVGQRQRAAVARALAHDPAILLADEPTASVHPTQADEIIGLLTEAAGAGTAVVVATHDIARAEAAGLEIVPCVPDATGASSHLLRAG